MNAPQGHTIVEMRVVGLLVIVAHCAYGDFPYRVYKRQPRKQWVCVDGFCDRDRAIREASATLAADWSVQKDLSLEA